MAAFMFLASLACGLVSLLTLVECGCFHGLTPDQGFDAAQFAGVWYTRARTSKNVPGAVRRFEVTDNGGIHFKLTFFHPRTMQCIPPMEQVINPVTSVPGKYSVNFRGHNAMVQFFRFGDDHAFVYVCVLRSSGVCRRIIGEIIARNTDAMPEDVQGAIDARILSDGCLDLNQFQPTSHDSQFQCPVPEFDSRKKRTAAHQCEIRVDDIPVVSHFTMAQMSGVWHEIARTRFTYNQMESGVYNYIYNQEAGILTGVYSGTKAGICQPSMAGQSKRKSDSTPGGDLLARIGGEGSVFPWAPFKIVHADSEGILFYACYLTKHDGSCAQNYTEVTLVSRTRHHTAWRRGQVSEILTNLCLNPAHLRPSDTTVDCTNNVVGGISASGNIPDVSSCLLDNIPVQENFDLQAFLGDWYVVASIEHGQRLHSGVAFVRYTTGAGGYIMESVAHSSANGQCGSPRTYLVNPRCQTSQNGNYLTTYGSGMLNQWTSMKILWTDYNLAVVYTCTKEKLDGVCESDGVLVRFLSREQGIEDSVLRNVALRTIQSVCTNLLQMVRLPHRVNCFSSLPSPTMPESRCNVENIPVRMPVVNQQAFSGMWYEIARTRGPVFMFDSNIVYYRVEDTGYMSLRYAGRSVHTGQCFVLEGTMRPRCDDRINGDYIGRMQMQGHNMWVTWKLLYTDYETYTVAYSCSHHMDDGTCDRSGIKLHVLGRTQHIVSQSSWSHINDIIRSTCVEPEELEYVHFSTDCSHAVMESLA